jgi:hypothetical protein
LFLDHATVPRAAYLRSLEILDMRIRLAVAGLATGLLIGGCSTYGVLPDTTKLPQPVLRDTVKTMQETAQNHGAEAAKKIEGAR